MDTQTQIERLIELAIVQRSELKQLVSELPQLREYLSAEIERTFEETEPQIRTELEEFCKARATDEHAKTGAALAAKVEELSKQLEVTTSAKYSVLMAERAENANLLAKAEARIEDAASMLSHAVKEIVTDELSRFPRAGEIDQLRKEFAEPRGLNPRGRWTPDETYQRLDLVTINGDSFVSNIDGNRERPSRTAGDWTLSAARGNGGGGGGVTSMTDLVPVPTNGQLLIGNGSAFVNSTLTAGTGISISNGAGSITINATDGNITLDDGTAAAPSLNFTNEPTTGLFRASANVMGFAVAGTSRATMTATGMTVTGTIAPTGSVHAAAGSLGNPSIAFNADQNTGIYNIGPDNIGVVANGAKVLDIATTGLGVTGTLSVSGVATLGAGAILNTPASATLTNATGLPISTGVSGLGANVAAFLATPSSANLAAALTDETGTGANVFATSPTLTTPISATLTSPAATDLTLAGGSSGASLVLGQGASGVPVLTTTNEFSLGTLTTTSTQTGVGNLPVFQFRNSNSTVNNGVALRYSSVDTGSTYRSGTEVGTIFTARTASTISAALYFATSNAGALTERMRIAANGDVGIGTTSPAQKLDVRGGSVLVNTDGGFYSATGNSIFFGVDATPVNVAAIKPFGLGDDTYGLSFFGHNGSSLGERMRMLGNGNVLIGTTSETGLTGAGGLKIASTTAGSSGAGALIVAGGISAGQSAQASYFGGAVTTAGQILSANTGLFSTDATLSNYSATNGVYLNGNAGGWLRLKGDGTGASNIQINGGSTGNITVDAGSATRLTINGTTGAATFAGAVTAAVVTSTGAGYTNSGFQITNTSASRTTGFFLSNAGVTTIRDVTGVFDLFTINTSGNASFSGTISPQQTGTPPTYVKGAIYFDTALNKLRVGGATAWETITSV